MFLSGIAQGVGQGMTNIAKGEQDRLSTDSKRLQIEEAKKTAEHNRQMRPYELSAAQSGKEKTDMEVEMLKMQLQQVQDVNMRDTTFSYVDEYIQGDNKGDEDLLRTALIQNPTVRDRIAKDPKFGVNLQNITDVVDNDDGTLTFKNSHTGKESTVPTFQVYTGIGYFTKRDQVQIKKAEQEMATEKARWDLNKTKSEVYKTQAEASKLNQESIKIQREQQKIQAETMNYKEIVDLAENPKADTNSLNKASSKIKYNKEVMEKLLKDDLYTGTNEHLSMYDAASDLNKQVDMLAEGLMKDPVNTVKNFVRNRVGYNISPEKEKQIAEANTMQTKLMLLTMDYLQYKSGAAFGQVELEGYQKATGSQDLTDPKAAKEYMKGFTEYLQRRAKSKIEENTSAEGKVLLKTRLGNIDKYNDYSLGDSINIQGKEYEIIGWALDGKPQVKPKDK